MTTTKKDLALKISERLGVRKQLAYEVVDTLFKAMRESLIAGNRIEIRGFGVLGVKDTKPKPAARNPRTGEIVYVPARKKSYFKAGVLIKKALHKPLEEIQNEEAQAAEQPISPPPVVLPFPTPPPTPGGQTFPSEDG
ncbi:MAG: integration host factor subunit beta [bacterium]|nr:integration host factor subunit beta [bacterium]